MTDDPKSFSRFIWDDCDSAYFCTVANEVLNLTLLTTPDMTPREQDYFWRMAAKDAMLDLRTNQLKEVCREIERKDEEIEILNSKLENQGDLTKRRGAFVLQVTDALERHSGAATLEEVDAVKLLMEKAPLEIRIKPSAKNPYKLVTDAFEWAIKLARKAGRLAKREVSTVKKLRCLRVYDNVTVPKRPEKRRRLPGEPKQMEAWAAGYTPFFRDLREDSYDPGG